jgi:lysylphosphatidylglycerol synthetase-like protein (DUF2156 family)
MYQQVFDPVSNSLALSSLFAVLPLVTLFVLLGGLRWKAQWAGLTALAVAILVAVLVYSMPVGQALDAALLGAVFGFFPIMWIVINASWIYNPSRPGTSRSCAAPFRPSRMTSASSDHHRVLLRPADRGAGRLRHAGGHHLGDAARPRL